MGTVKKRGRLDFAGFHTKTMNVDFDLSRVSLGLVGTKCAALPLYQRVKIITYKPGTPECRYNAREALTWYPLQYGNGIYDVYAAVETGLGTGMYKLAERVSVPVSLPDPDTVFLQSCVNMPWDGSMKCVVKARALGLYAEIRAYIINRFSYDKTLAEEIVRAGKKYDYVPDVEKTFATGKDICFGLTALFNSMLRSVGIKAKMCHGHYLKTNAYHAWSEVQRDGLWKTVDITRDIAGGKPVDCDAAEHEVRYVY